MIWNSKLLRLLSSGLRIIGNPSPWPGEYPPTVMISNTNSKSTLVCIHPHAQLSDSFSRVMPIAVCEQVTMSGLRICARVFCLHVNRSSWMYLSPICRLISCRNGLTITKDRLPRQQKEAKQALFFIAHLHSEKEEEQQLNEYAMNSNSS